MRIGRKGLVRLILPKINSGKQVRELAKARISQMMYVYSLALNNASYAKTCTDVLSANEIDTSFITASVSHAVSV